MQRLFGTFSPQLPGPLGMSPHLTVRRSLWVSVSCSLQANGIWSEGARGRLQGQAAVHSLCRPT